MIVEQRLWGESDLTLVDVGASGGIDRRWQLFLPAFSAIGFDHDCDEIERLRRETHPGVRYEAAFVGSSTAQAERPDRIAHRAFARSSAGVIHARRASPPPRLSDQRITLDDYFPVGTNIDALKIDTDGNDLAVVRGAHRLFHQDHEVLWLAIEAPLIGERDPGANIFSNIDNALAGAGFVVVDIHPHRYSRAALPTRFAWSVPAGTVSGPVLWADALYIRDLGDRTYAEQWRYEVTRTRLLKAVALMTASGLYDCAAEALLAYPEHTTIAERHKLLNLLAEACGLERTYRAHMRRFATDPTAFYPVATQTSSHVPDTTET